MAGFERIRTIKKEVQPRLFAIPGVYAVGIGGKKVRDQRTGELAIMVFVGRKKPLAEIPASEVIPAEIEGIKTDVVESPLSKLCDDENQYSTLVGGIQIAAGWLGYDQPLQDQNSKELTGKGTLGCIALTNDAPPKIVALTCQHVVAGDQALSPPFLTIAGPDVNGVYTFTQSPNAGTVVAFDWLEAGKGGLVAIYLTLDTETPASVAHNIATRINSVASTPVVQNNNTITVPAGMSGTWNVYPNRSAVIPVASGLRPSSNGGVITLSGLVERDSAIYTNFNVGGPYRSYGTFALAKRGTDLASVASAIKSSLDQLIADAKIKDPGLSAVGLNVSLGTVGNAQTITISGVQETECYITPDVRVGHPQANFQRRCCPCSQMRIGTVIAARLDVDAAIIQLDPKVSCKAEIQGIGEVKGYYAVTAADASVVNPTFKVTLRGRTTTVPRTTIIDSIDIDGFLPLHDPRNPCFHRYFTGAMKFERLDTAGTALGSPGDSGAAVVIYDGPNQGKVVGVFFGADDHGYTFATQIDQIMDALDIQVATPTTLAAAVAAQPANATAATTDELVTGGMPFSAVAGAVSNGVEAAEQEMQATAAGRNFAEAVRRHFTEAMELIQTNRRVATVWHRSGGPQILNSFLRIVQFRDEPLLNEVDGRPLRDCLARMHGILARHGSAALAADLNRYLPTASTLGGLTFTQIISALQMAGME